MRSSITIIVPFLNEEECVARFIDSVVPILKSCSSDFEIIFVDDGSIDGSIAALVPYLDKSKSIKLIQLARNFGKDVALTCGMDNASMDCVIPMDIDLQDPPELISEMVRLWQNGADVVNAIRKNRDSDGLIKRASANVFYYIMTKYLKVGMVPNAGDFRLLDRRVVNVVKMMREKSRFMKGLLAWPGFKTSSVYYVRPDRSAGRTKWNYWKLWLFALDGVFAFSSAPLKWWTYIGFKIAAFSFLYAIFIITKTLVTGVAVPGYASIITCILFLGGIQLMSIGVLGEYVARIYDEVKNRPLYVEANKVNF